MLARGEGVRNEVRVNGIKCGEVIKDDISNRNPTST